MDPTGGRGGGGYHQQQQQQQQYQGQGGAGGYYDHYDDPNLQQQQYHHQQQQYHHQQQQQQVPIIPQHSDSYGMYDAAPPEMYYENDEQYSMSAMPAMHPHQQQHPAGTTVDDDDFGQPGSYRPSGVLQPSILVGDPISAVCYDDRYAAVTVASFSRSVSGSSTHHQQTRHQQRSGDHHRASMLLTHNAADGTLYSSVAGHPEAPARVLAAVDDALYGGGTTASSSTSTASSTTTNSPRRAGTGGGHHVPNHAYRPPYLGTDPAALAAANNSYDPNHSHSHNHRKVAAYQMGITSLVPVVGMGYVASVSPAAVRVHAAGGLQVADMVVEGMLCGTAHPTHHGGGGGGHHHRNNADDGTTDPTTHVTVGGLAVAGEQQEGGNGSSSGSFSRQNRHQLLCVDLWQGLRTVASCSLDRRADVGSKVAVTALATNHDKGSIVAGCSDGTVRLFDGRLRELANIRSHAGGVVGVAVSGDGTLFATTGFGSRAPAARAAGCPPYGFPDPTVLVYDIRYLGRGGIPHPFAGSRGGPRFLSFVPDVEGKPSNRLLVASGQPGGGIHILQPLSGRDATTEDAADFISPPLDRDCITAMCVSEDNLALGTSQGTVLQYRLVGYNGSSSYGTTGSAKGGIFVPRSGGAAANNRSTSPDRNKKQPLEIPPFEPPPLSLDASILRTDDPNSRPGMRPQIKSIFSAYVLNRNPTVSPIGDARDATTTTFGPLAASAAVAPSRLRVSSALLGKATHAVDFLATVPTSALDVDLLEDHRPGHIKARVRSTKPTKPNPNKLLYTNQLFSLAYEESLNRTKKLGRKSQQNRLKPGDQDSGDGGESIPNRYRLTIRPAYKSSAVFSHSELNSTGFIPGWDCPPSMHNAFIAPVLMLLYLMPEMKSTVLASAMVENAPSQSSKERSLMPELDFLFHRIDSISRNSMLFPGSVGGSMLARVGVWAPSNFIACLTAMPEAEQLQILDGSPSAVDAPRRPEAFYRFLLYQIDKETGKSLDPLGAMDFVSINEFISGSDPSSESVNRVMTVDLSYKSFFRDGSDGQSEARFGDVLQRTLCKETRLRAWSQVSKSYETIVQRKIATSLPSVLSISCACAGRKDEEGLKLWRGTSNGGLWLPEMIEVELDGTGSVVVREFVSNGDSGEGKWVECVSKDALPQSISDIVAKVSTESSIRKRRYHLEAVLSTVRDDLDRNPPELLNMRAEDGPFGHHVLHKRVGNDYRKHVLEEQIEELERFVASASSGTSSDVTVLGSPSDEGLQQRLELARERLRGLKESVGDEWVLLNGFVVSNTIIDDARAFHNRFKEPSLVVFRSVDPKPFTSLKLGRATIPPEVLNTLSLTNGTKSPLADSQNPFLLPGRGQMVAFDAEFVSVQEEESDLTESGSKVILRETRHAVGRISVIDCRMGTVLIDDHVLPRERVVDYLTRFSGIVEKDLDPKQSVHHLIGTRAAYLKMRYLMERGCIFVGHGLQQDFWTLNLAVPANQIIDTVEIYHKPAQRSVSLRFLTNFVLKRDMQQDVHDSVEDAMAAHELFRKAVELKERGEFDQLLDDLYAYGQKNDWKLGVDNH